MEIRQALPTADSWAIAIYTENQQLSVGIRRDGSIEYGPGFTTNEAAAKRFWEAMSEGMKAWLEA